MTPFSGLYVATLTPFDSSGRVDFGVLKAHIDFLVEGGAAGICPCGTTGEWLYLSVGEKTRIVERAAASAAGRLPVMAGVGALALKETTLLCRSAESSGASAVFLTPPIYYPASLDAVYAHYVLVREACSLPVFAYNIPSYAANEISMPCVERLVDSGTIDGIKDSTGDAARMEGLVQGYAKRITIMAASDSFVTDAKRLGAHGFISALANIWPRTFARLWEGDDSAQTAVDSARKAVKEAGGIPALKRLASLRGFDFGCSRLPSVELTDMQHNTLKSLIDRSADLGLA
jgi:4-hydroxy-tetrahydrodipicolinate synthase